MKSRLLIIFFLSTNIIGIWGQENSYPHIPDSILGRYERISYMGNNFFENYDFTIPQSDISPILMSDFIYILSLLKESDISTCVINLIAQTQHDNNLLGKVLYWFDRILYDSTSPQYNEELYLDIITTVLESDIDSSHKIIPIVRKEILLQNRVGYVANNFLFFNKRGESNFLYDIESKYLLLFFNNPECNSCQQVKKILETEQQIKKWEKNENMRIFAISPDANEGLWQSEQYDKSWIVGIDRDNVIYKKQLYDIQRLPTFYLLDSNKRVLLKEANIERVLDFLKNNFHK